jgi:hypothetical protein
MHHGTADNLTFVFVATLALLSSVQALGPTRSPEERQAFGTALEAGLVRRLVDYPTRN